MADIVILAAQGPGAEDACVADHLFAGLREALGDDWSRVHTETFHCSAHLHSGIERIFEGMQKRDMDFLRARKFLLYAQAEGAAQLTDVEQRGGAYDKGQQSLYSVLERAAGAAGDTAPVILLSHSVACSAVSNYLWDAQRPTINHGLWRDGGPKGVHKGSARDLFLRLKTLSHWYSLGPVLPLWNAALSREQIQAVTSNTRGYNFRWKNFFHPDDLFGWPLKPLSPSYNQSVYRDYETSPLGDWAGTNLGPQIVAHGGYWDSPLVQQHLLDDVRQLLKRGKSRVGAGARSQAAVAV